MHKIHLKKFNIRLKNDLGSSPSCICVEVAQLDRACLLKSCECFEIRRRWCETGTFIGEFGVDVTRDRTRFKNNKSIVVLGLPAHNNAISDAKE
jgi:hypothetical protein